MLAKQGMKSALFKLLLPHYDDKGIVLQNLCQGRLISMISSQFFV